MDTAPQRGSSAAKGVRLARIERQELHCHNCDKYVQFDLDVELNGNHVLKCPNCGHEHCRVVKDGVIGDTRWDSRNAPVGQVAPNGLMTYPVSTTTITYTVTSTYTIYNGTTGTGDTYLYMRWLDTAAGA